MDLQPSQGMDDASSLFTIFGRLPDDLQEIVCDQVEEFVHQASFLRRAALYQAHVLHTKGIVLERAEEAVAVKPADADGVVLDPAVGEELNVVHSLTTKLPPVLEQDIAASFDEETCKPQAVHRWFEERNDAMSKACSRIRKKHGSTASASVSMRGNAVIRSIASQPEEVVHDAASALAACLSPMSALETSMKLMSLLKSNDPSKPGLKDNCASRAFALVSKCPAVMLQSMFLRAVTNTSGVQLTALDRTESYTVIAQWLQDAVHQHNEPLVQLCLGALRKIPFTEVHIICFARHHMISGTEPAAGVPTAANNPTILDYVRRLTEAGRPPAVQQAAQALLDKWGRVDLESDHVILSGAQQQRRPANFGRQKGAKGPPAEPLRPQVFPNDRRMKAPQPIALHRDGRGSVELAKSNSSNMSKAAAQRRAHVSSGPLSVSDIKKRKQQQQLMQKLGKKQRSLPGTSSAAVRPHAAATAAAATLRSPSKAPVPNARGNALHGAVQAAVRLTGADNRQAPAAKPPLARAASTPGGSPFAANTAIRSPQGDLAQRRPQSQEGRQVSVPGSPGLDPGSPAGAAHSPGGQVSADMDDQRGLSTLLQITQHAAEQQVQKRRETLPVPWQVAEVCLDEAKQRLAAAMRRGSQWHPEVRAALQTAVAQGEAASQARWAAHASGNASSLDKGALEELSDGDETWTTPEALTALSEQLMQICASWAADSKERAVQREREYLAAAVPPGPEPVAVRDPDDAPEVDEAAAAADNTQRVPFWLQPPEDAGADEWRHFDGRTHMVGAAQAWRAGLRFLFGEPGIPPSGISAADDAAARRCDGTLSEDVEPPIPAAAQPVAPAATHAVHEPASPHHQPLYPAAPPGPPPQQEYQPHHPPPAAPMLMHMQPQVYQGGAGGYGVVQAVQYEQPGHVAPGMGPAPGAQYVQQLAPGQQVVYAQLGMQYAGGGPVYGGQQYMQQAQGMPYAGQQYLGGQAAIYHYAQQAGPAGGCGEQPGRMY
eukprot:jgi/Ulvmu1/12066/UM083_0079.1